MSAFIYILGALSSVARWAEVWRLRPLPTLGANLANSVSILTGRSAWVGKFGGGGRDGLGARIGAPAATLTGCAMVGAPASSSSATLAAAPMVGGGGGRRLPTLELLIRARAVDLNSHAGGRSRAGAPGRARACAWAHLGACIYARLHPKISILIRAS